MEKCQGKGYYRTKATDSVIDIMEGIVADANADLALVFDDTDKLLGLFTDYDYIKLATE